MKTLLLLLGVVLVCDGQIPSVDVLTQLSGEWNLLLVSANNIDKISNNGPFRAYMHNIEVDILHYRILFKFAVRVNGLCTEKSVVGSIGSDNVISSDYSGQNSFRILHQFSDSIILYNVNVDSAGKTTKLLGLLGRGDHPNEQEVAKFKELMKEHNIPEANIINIRETDKCPKNSDSNLS